MANEPRAPTEQWEGREQHQKAEESAGREEEL